MLDLIVLNFSKVHISEDIYRNEYPSITSSNSYTKVYINISLISIDNVDERAMMFSAKIRVQLKWFDRRLVYHNLRAEMKSGNNVGVKVTPFLDYKT